MAWRLKRGLAVIWRRSAGRSPFSALVMGLVGWMIYSQSLVAADDLNAELEFDPDVIVVMRQQAFHILKGAVLGADTMPPRFMLHPGDNVIIMLRNEDPIEHDFVSPLLNQMEFRFAGRGTVLYTLTAGGVRVGPGETVTLRFDLPGEDAQKKFHFWCNIHGKIFGDVMRGEIFTLEVKQEAPVGR
jgi:uncharacterized cupredoxin-like copper-binding protein